MRASTTVICAGLFCTTAAMGLNAVAQAPARGVIPATAPTSSVSDLPSAHPSAKASTQPTGSSHVDWDGAQLTIDAGGDSLRSVLVQVKSATGMKVTGGIPDERVYGKYGPGPVQLVMAQIFDGLAVNLLLLNDSPTRPKELILTARTGGVTPPMANPIRADESVGRPNGRGFNGPGASLPNQQLPQQPPQQQPGQPGMTPDGGQGNPNGGPPPAASSTDSSATDANGSGGRTPEQIFEELRKRQQQGSGTAQ